jgi:hypothetical protein
MHHYFALLASNEIDVYSRQNPDGSLDGAGNPPTICPSEANCLRS